MIYPWLPENLLFRPGYSQTHTDIHLPLPSTPSYVADSEQALCPGDAPMLKTLLLFCFLRWVRCALRADWHRTGFKSEAVITQPDKRGIRGKSSQTWPHVIYLHKFVKVFFYEFFFINHNF